MIYPRSWPVEMNDGRRSADDQNAPTNSTKKNNKYMKNQNKKREQTVYGRASSFLDLDPSFFFPQPKEKRNENLKIKVAGAQKKSTSKKTQCHHFTFTSITAIETGESTRFSGCYATSRSAMLDGFLFLKKKTNNKTCFFL